MGLLSKAVSVHRGQMPLGETYWCWLILPQLCITALFLIISLNSFALLKLNSALYYGPVFFLQVLLVAILFFFGIGVLRSARTARSRVWANIASILVVIGFITTPVQLLSDWFGIGSPDESEIGRQIGLLNAQLPRRLDQITTMDKIEYSDHVLYYHYTIDAAAIEKVSFEALQALLVKGGCQDWKRDLDNGTFSRIDYQYSGGGRLLRTISIMASSCG